VKAKWLTEWNDLAARGFSLEAACAMISRHNGCHRTTVRRYLDPAYGTQNLISSRRRYARKKAERIYQRSYRRITRPRTQQRILNSLYVHVDTLTLNEIAEALPALPLIGGVHFQPPTIERRLLEGHLDHQAKGRIRGPLPYLALVDPATRTWYFGNDPPPVSAHEDRNGDQDPRSRAPSEVDY